MATEGPGGEAGQEGPPSPASLSISPAWAVVLTSLGAPPLSPLGGCLPDRPSPHPDPWKFLSPVFPLSGAEAGPIPTLEEGPASSWCGPLGRSSPGRKPVHQGSGSLSCPQRAPLASGWGARLQM